MHPAQRRPARQTGKPDGGPVFRGHVDLPGWGRPRPYFHPVKFGWNGRYPGGLNFIRRRPFEQYSTDRVLRVYSMSRPLFCQLRIIIVSPNIM